MDPTQVSAVTLLGAACLALWRMIIAQTKKNDQHHEKCTNELKDTTDRLHKLEIKQAVFMACMGKPCPAKDALAQQEFRNKHNHETQTYTTDG